MNRNRPNTHALAALALLSLAPLALAGCASPVRAVRVSPTDAHRDLTRSAITTGELSWSARDVLIERGLLDTYDEDPASAIAGLHERMVAENGAPDLLFALAEASYLHGRLQSDREYLMAAVVYAYAFLFPDDAGVYRPGPFDPRFRTAADLYNWALGSALAADDGKSVAPRAGGFELPFGRIDVAFDPAELRAGRRELFDFVPLSEFEVRGLDMRYRRPGIGAPLAASTRVVAGATGTDLVAPRLKVPLTALLRISKPRRSLVAGEALAGSLHLHIAWDDDSVQIGEERVPLENEPSAALALTFTGIPVVKLEMLGFLGRLTGVLEERPPLVSTTPYRPGMIPVVFVHGTASSIVRWAELYNRLHADPELRRRYQFWFFQYDSDNPIALSALHLRDALRSAIDQLDPDGTDAALRQMVLIGHSQGGLLVKLQAISTGDRLWNAVSRKPLDELRLTDEDRALIERGLFLEPLPEVARVIFISTPHRGSFIATRLVSSVLRRLTHLPGHLTQLSADLARNLDAAKSPFMASAVDNMSPLHPFILGLQQIPVAPGIPAHSIISVIDPPPLVGGNDGVVEYTSAHIEGVESERVVDSPHSCQGHPDTMEEVRRILRLHAKLTPSVRVEEKTP